MKDWVLSDGGDKWSVKFDVRDLGGHLDTACRGWSATLAARVRLVVARLVQTGPLISPLTVSEHCGLSSSMSGIWEVIWILPFEDGLQPWLLGFVWLLLGWFLSLFFPWISMVGYGLSGLCICLLLSMGLKPLCLLLIAYANFVSSILWGWCGHVVSLWPVLELCFVCWMGPLGVTLHFVFVWFRFRLLRRYLALWPTEVGRVYRLLEMVGEGSAWTWSYPSSFC